MFVNVWSCKQHSQHSQYEFYFYEWTSKTALSVQFITILSCLDSVVTDGITFVKIKSGCTVGEESS